MSQELEQIFGELGIPQYLEAFVDQGFDTWDTILDITESDLDALSVKLGHRRKLQRRIANSRGHAPDASLGPRLSTDDSRPEGPRPDGPRNYHKDGTAIVKRKYRRHPKPDENAPERPPSAYVLFSNKMRDDLKNQNLTFTEIAKLVGENWQSLSLAQREPFESQANRAKEKYNQELNQYKKTPEHKKYSHYLQEFKQKQALQLLAKDAAKRPKLESSQLQNGSSGSNVATPASGSGSDSQHDAEPPAREQRYNSIVFVNETSYNSPTAPTPMSVDESTSPTSTHVPDHHAATSPHSVHHRSPPPLQSWGHDAMQMDHHHPLQNGSQPPLPRTGRDGSHPSLPSLSDMFHDAGGHGSDLSRSPDSHHAVGGFARGGSRLAHDGPSPPPGSDGRGPPPFRPSPTSSHGARTASSSASSSGFASSYPRTPGGSSDGSLPIRIDALLSSGDSYFGPQAMAGSPDHGKGTGPPHMFPPSGLGPRAHVNGGGMNGYHSPPANHHHPSAYSPPSPPREGGGKAPTSGDRRNLDGMSALLQAGEIVDRRAR